MIIQIRGKSVVDFSWTAYLVEVPDTLVYLLYCFDLDEADTGESYAKELVKVVSQLLQRDQSTQEGNLVHVEKLQVTTIAVLHTSVEKLMLIFHGLFLQDDVTKIAMKPIF